MEIAFAQVWKKHFFWQRKHFLASLCIDFHKRYKKMRENGNEKYWSNRGSNTD